MNSCSFYTKKLFVSLATLATLWHADTSVALDFTTYPVQTKAPLYMALGGNGDIWELATESTYPYHPETNRIFRHDQLGNLIEIQTPTIAGGYNLHFTPSGQPWLFNDSEGALGTIIGDKIVSKTHFSIPIALSGVVGVRWSSKDGSFWTLRSVTSNGVDYTSRLVRVMPSGKVTSIPVPSLGLADCIETSELKFVCMDSSNHLIRLGINGLEGQLNLPEISRQAQDPVFGLLNRIAMTPDGTLWISQRNRITRIAPQGAISVILLQGERSIIPGKGLVGPDGNIWFVMSYYNDAVGISAQKPSVARITPGGEITYFTLPSDVTSADFVAHGVDPVRGVDNSLWFFTEDDIPANYRLIKFTLPDQCPKDSKKITPGICGCGISDIDKNKNRKMDCLELAAPTVTIQKRTVTVRVKRTVSGSAKVTLSRKAKNGLRALTLAKTVNASKITFHNVPPGSWRASFELLGSQFSGKAKSSATTFNVKR